MGVCHVTNPNGQFVECPESSFAKNDFYPSCVMIECRHDPERLSLLRGLWGMDK